MKDASEFSLILVTAGNQESAEKIAQAVITSRQAACANIIPHMHSMYRWKGAIESGQEVLLLIKAPTHGLDALEETIRAAHSYEVPEILSISLDQSSAPYLEWLRKETETERKKR